MSNSHIIKRISKEDYKRLIGAYREKMVVSSDALFRLSEGQRKVFKEEELISLLTKENPRFIGLQKNGRYAAFFRRKDGFIRVIFTIEHKRKLEIITFFTTENIPLIKNGK